jgi:hypothetical protein
MWALDAQLEPDDYHSYGHFGELVKIQGDTLVASTYLVSDGTYVFTRSGSTWIQAAKLQGAGIPSDARFGIALAIDGDTILVGAPYYDLPGAVDAGLVSVFVRSGEAWSEQCQIVPPVPTSNLRFGSALSLARNTAIIGAPGVGSSSGIHIYVGQGATWSYDSVISPDFGPSTGMGANITHAGQLMATSRYSYTARGGAPQDYVDTLVFEQRTSGWVQQQRIVHGYGPLWGQPRNSLALSGTSLLMSMQPPGANYRVVGVYSLNCHGNGDFDGDGDVDLADFAELARCLDESASGLAAECEALDMDGDGDVDLSDFAAMQTAW